MPLAIETNALSKRYRIGEDFSSQYQYRTLRDALTSLRRRRRVHPAREIWALREVDLEIDEGEVVGVIGRNGAGKTTLLKILARISEPTSGIASTKGRVGALLDVGTGFHPELTGRENIYLNGAILGLSRHDVARRFDEIVGFAGIEAFLDTPLKRFSAGMSVRLAFAVAAHVEPPIIVVDEVLAVGDAEFQQRCLGKMSEFGQDGRTVLFVSHDLGAIGQLCRRAVWLDDGVVRDDGPSREVIARYLSRSLSVASSVEYPGDEPGPVQVRAVAITDDSGSVLPLIRRDQPLTIRISFTTHVRIPDLDVSIFVRDRRGTHLIDESWSETMRTGPDGGAAGDYLVTLRISPILASGDYTLGIWIGSTLGGSSETYLHRDLMVLTLAPAEMDRTDNKAPRVVRPTVHWELTRR